MLLVNSQAMIWAASIPIAIAVLAFAYWKYRHYRKALTTSRRKRKWIFEVLKAANESNSFLYLRFVNPKLNKKDIRLETKKLTKHHLHCTTDLEAIDPSLLKQPTTIFFNLTRHKKIIFYSFDAVITELSPKTLYLELSITLPKNFGNDQRRQLLRLVPSQSLIESLSVWNGQITQAETPESETPPEQSGSTANSAANPNAASKPLEQPKQIITWVAIPPAMPKIQNISGGGLKLAIPDSYAQQNKLDRNSLFLMKLSLKNIKITPQNPLPQLNLVLVGSCVHTTQGIDEHSLIRQKGLGIMFLRFALPDSGKKLTWLPIDSKRGIAPLVAWVLETQYALQRRSWE